jgi:hypothetical protein
MKEAESNRRIYIKFRTLASASLKYVLHQVVAPKEKKLNILCFEAHPTYPEFGCGRTMARNSDIGHSVSFLSLTKGEVFVGEKSISFNQVIDLHTKNINFNSKMRRILSIIVTTIILFLIVLSANAQQTYNYTIPPIPWAENLGNHRAILNITANSDVAYLDFEWRRHDKYVDKHNFIIINAATNQRVANIFRKIVDNEHCELYFGPVSAGKYYFYYLPYGVDKDPGWGTYNKDYLPREAAPEIAWIKKNDIPTPKSDGYLVATCNEVQARTEFESFYPMEVIAIQEEKRSLVASNKGDFLLFPEDRKYPIRMFDNIPQRWVGASQSTFSGIAKRNEYYVFQVGLWAFNSNISDVKMTFSPLVGTSFSLPVSAMTCFNMGGVNSSGQIFSKTINVGQGKVQPLWIGLDLPKDIPAGKYVGKLTVTASNAIPKEVEVEITIMNDILVDRGDAEPWRHSRLRWLNSTAGIDDSNVLPYSHIKVLGNGRVNLTGKEVLFAPSGLPSSIKVYGEEVLATPIRFSIFTNSGEVKLATVNAKQLKLTSGVLSKLLEQGSEQLKLTMNSEFEFDGWMKYTIEIEALEDLNISDVQLAIPYRKETSTYIIGMGLPGTETPKNRETKWGGPYDSFWSIPSINPKGLRFDNGADLNYGPYDSFWLGNVDAGLHCELRGASYTGPMINWYHTPVPPTWNNKGRGGFKIKTVGDTCTAITYVGPSKLLKGQKLKYEFAFLITPVKHLNLHSQFVDRYYHNTTNPYPTENDLATGIKVINLHHGNKYNPYINYPFNATAKMKQFVDTLHDEGMNIKIYYTLRMLSNHATEIWAFRSLGSEVFTGGSGGGHPWLREHFLDDYDVQWYQRNDSVDVCNGILTTSEESRLYNYYVEGLRWLVENIDIDGLYLDDVAFGRDMLKRIRKVVTVKKPDFLIDIHSHRGATGAPALQYAEFYPYVDKVWFGEDFMYNQMPPANWLTESSGIPFGLMGDMLEGGGNPWRGMLYGMSSRLPWMGDPTEMWKLWDSFGIADSKMVGYWEEKPVVTTSNKDVLATAYIKDKKILISIASWATEKVSVHLNIDYKRLGLAPEKVTITAPEINMVQTKQTFTPAESITIDPTKGLILLIEEL